MLDIYLQNDWFAKPSDRKPISFRRLNEHLLIYLQKKNNREVGVLTWLMSLLTADYQVPSHLAAAAESAEEGLQRTAA